MIARASSGSRFCSSSVEPLMSAESTVTVLRSPSKPSAADRSWVTSTFGAFAPVALWAAAAIFVLRAAPHFRQKLASLGFRALQDAHRSSTLAPHFMQKSASAGFSLLHFAQ